MLRLSAEIRERRHRRLTAYDFDPGLRLVVKILSREALDRLAVGLDLPPEIRELLATAPQMSSPPIREQPVTL